MPDLVFYLDSIDDRMRIVEFMLAELRLTQARLLAEAKEDGKEDDGEG